MNLNPRKVLTPQEVQKSLNLVIWDGLASETMNVLVSGAFLVAFALLMGASNFQIGLLAALPTFTNIFQLISIWLVQRFNNRRAVSVICSLLARFPLVLVGVLVIFFGRAISIQWIIPLLFIYYFFGSIAAPSWNSWMKDLVPENTLGAYFSRRSRYTQILNTVLSIVAALCIDYVKDHYRQYELNTYSVMYIIGGSAGLIGAFVLSRAQEPQSYLVKENVFKLIRRPLKDPNFRRLLVFNSAWVFAINIATPFFTVYMMKSIGLSISYVIGLTMVSQLCSILTIRIWGIFADRYSNKTIIAIGAPLYICCIIAWCFVGIYTRMYANILLLLFIHIFTGIATAGINLSLTNIGLKMAPKEDAIVYLSARNIITAVFSSLAPLIGGSLADFFEKRHIIINAQYVGPRLNKVFHLVSLHEWNFLFLIGALIAFIALELLMQVKESGEVEKDTVVRIMRSSLKNNLKDNFLIGNLIHWREQFWTMLKKRKTT